MATQTASEQLRVKWAKHVIDPSTPAEQRSLLNVPLLQPIPENVAAQMIFYPFLGKENQAAMEKRFTDYSSEAWQRCCASRPKSSRRQKWSPPQLCREWTQPVQFHHP